MCVCNHHATLCCSLTFSFDFFNIFVPTYIPYHTYNTQYVNYVAVNYLNDFGNWIQSVNVIVLTLKLFKYFRVSPKLNIMLLTISRAGSTMAYFLAIMLLTVLGFAIAFYCAFNAELEEFSSIDKAMGSLLFGVLGDGVDFREISKANRLLAPAFHFLFTFVVSILFFSLFITMVDEAYSQVKEEQAKGRSDDITSDMLTTRILIVKNQIIFKFKKTIRYACPKLPQYYRCVCKICCGAQYDDDEIRFLARTRPDVRVKRRKRNSFDTDVAQDPNHKDRIKMFEEHLIRPRQIKKKGWFDCFDKNSRERTRGRGHWVKAWQKQRKQEEKVKALILKYAVRSRKNRRNKTLSSSPSMVFHVNEANEANDVRKLGGQNLSKYSVAKKYRLEELKHIKKQAGSEQHVANYVKDIMDHFEQVGKDRDQLVTKKFSKIFALLQSHEATGVEMKNDEKEEKNETDETDGSSDSDEEQQEEHGVHSVQQKQQMGSRRLSAATAAAASRYASVEPSTNSRIEEVTVEEEETGMVTAAAAETTLSTVKLSPTSNGQHRKVRGPTNKVEGSVLYFGAED